MFFVLSLGNFETEFYQKLLNRRDDAVIFQTRGHEKLET